MRGNNRSDLESRLAGLVDQGRRVRTGVEDNLQALVRAQLERLDVVPREEFEILQEQLTRAELRLAELEKQLDALTPTDNTDGVSS